MKEIKLNGETYKIDMNWKSAIEYERETKKNALDLETWQANRLEPIFNLGLAIMRVNNRDKNVPTFDELLDIIDKDEKGAADFISTVSNELLTFLHLKPGDQEQQEKKSKSKKGDSEKNA